VEIHAGFAQQLRKGEPAPLQVIVDANQLEYCVDCLGIYFADRGWFFSGVPAGQHLPDRSATDGGDADSGLAPRPWYNPDLRSRWFFIPGIVGSLTLVLVITLTAFWRGARAEIGTLEQIMVTPIRPAEFILSKTLPFFLIGLFDVFADRVGRLVVGFRFRFAVTFPCSFWALCCFFCACLGWAC